MPNENENTGLHYARNNVFSTARVNLKLFLLEGKHSLEETAKLAQLMQESIAHAYLAAVNESGLSTSGLNPESFMQDEELSDDNPFNPS